MENAAPEFKEYFLGLKNFGFGDDWDFYKLAEFLQKEFVYPHLGNGLNDFLDHIFSTFAHPFVAYFTRNLTFTVAFKRKSQKGNIYEKRFIFYFKVYGYKSYDLIYTVDSPFEKMSSFISITEKRMVSTPRILLLRVRELLSEEKGEISVSFFKRDAIKHNIVNHIAWVYSDASPIELVPIYFHQWEFFVIGRDCESCGRLLTNPVSVAARRGPECGGHGYKYAEAQVPNIRKIIETVSKARLYSRDSPLINSRIWNISNGFEFTDVEWSNFITNTKDRYDREGSLDSLIRRYIRKY